MKYLVLLVVIMFVVGCEKRITEARLHVVPDAGAVMGR